MEGIEDNTAFLEHYGILRRSGRYPWGSGKNPHQRNRQFLDIIEQHRKDGMSETEIAKAYDMTTTQLRALKSIAKNEQRAAMVSQATKLKAKGYSNTKVGEIMGISESSVRSLLDPAIQARADQLITTANMLRDSVKKNGFIDVGEGVHVHLGISKQKLQTAIAMLEEEGYAVHNIQVDQLTSSGKTLVKVLAPPGTTYRDIVSDTSKIKSAPLVKAYTEDGGSTWTKIGPPVNLDSKRIAIRYAEDGGASADGVIYIRPGVNDLSLGGRTYAQVRIAVDGTHYIKGMAMYRDDLPDGVDVLFNTNKSRQTPMLGPKDNSVLKPLKDDADLPFGSIVRQHDYVDKDGKTKRSVLNIVNDEGDWDEWSRTLSSQVLSKQKPELAKQQLEMTYLNKRAEFDEIMSLTNPAVKKKMLQEFADSADSAAVHLKAAALPGQKTHVILPFTSVREGEIYAPNYKDGERVVLIRFPHGGIFEIPELTVNNRNLTARRALGNAKAAVGINPKVANQLSGADFDGDTVLVIPQRRGTKTEIKTEAPLRGLKDFDPKISYPKYEGMKVMTDTQGEMGKISNLITDMTIKNAPLSEIERAVKHSMVVIDAEKHELNYKQSAIDHGIRELKEKYQNGADKGASTLISLASSQERVPKRKLRSPRDGGPIDPETGEKVYTYTGEGYVKRRENKKTGEVTETFVPRLELSTKMAETKDAYSLSSGTVREKIYADHANRLKALANQARKESLNIKPIEHSPSAKAVYRREVESLNAKLDIAIQNAPLERQAQLIGNAIVRAKKEQNPNLKAGEIKKIKAKALTDARAAVMARKHRVDITDREWEAIQAGAIRPTRLEEILRHADPKAVKKRALPRENPVMNKAMLTRAKSMLSMGYTQAEVAAALGVPPSTLSTAVERS